MKHLFTTLLILTITISSAIAQPRAIGARVGYNLEFSYQHSLRAHNMIECMFGATNVWNNWGYVEANAVFDWVFPIKNGWNWYVGPGAGLGVGYGPYWHNYGYSPLRINVGGQIGLEYQFKIPLNLSLDWRPMINLLGLNQQYYPIYRNFYNFAVGVRYRF